MRSHPALLSGGFLFCVLLSIAEAQGTRFDYRGRAAADPRSAELTFTIDGNRVTGGMRAQGIRKPNVRLAGATVDFTGRLTGTWEGPTGLIQGTWTGVDHFDPDQTNRGTILIRIKKPGRAYPNEVHLRLTGQRGQYGWCFPATGRVYAGGGGGGGPTGAAQNPLSAKPKRPAFCVAAYDNEARWKEARKLLPERYSLGGMEAKCFAGVLHLLVGERRIVYVGNGAKADLNTGKSIAGAISQDGPLGFYTEPSRVFTARASGKNGVEIEGVGKGVGKLCAVMPVTYTSFIDQQTGRGQLFHVSVVVVHEPEAPPKIQAEIPRVEIQGRAVARKDGSPVAGARVTLLWTGKDGGALGSYLTDANFMTDGNGRFHVMATGLPRGTFEVMIQQLGQASNWDPSRDSKDELPNANDLWPVNRYCVDLTPERANAGAVNAGTIVLDTVRNVFPAAGRTRPIVKVGAAAGKAKARAGARFPFESTMPAGNGEKPDAMKNVFGEP
jgi:hypothetical protein